MGRTHVRILIMYRRVESDCGCTYVAFCTFFCVRVQALLLRFGVIDSLDP